MKIASKKSIKTMDNPNTVLVTPIHKPGFETVIRIEEKSLNLVAFIAVHSTKIGPAIGGIRVQKYPSETAALQDVLALAEAMSYKSAFANTGLGGGKSVIMHCPQMETHRQACLAAFAIGLNSLEGQYYGAEDMGITTDDMATLKGHSPYVSGLDSSDSSGNPAPFTALGIYQGMRAGAQHLWGTSDLKYKTIAIQGAGQVGYYLAHLLVEAGANVMISDTNPKALEHLPVSKHIVHLPIDDILTHPCDILAPCARGQLITPEIVPHLRCAMIAGAANNQLTDDSVSQLLHQENILYLPDFVINAGGIINISVEINNKPYTSEKAKKRVLTLYDDVLELLNQSKDESPLNTAVKLCRLSLS